MPDTLEFRIATEDWEIDQVNRLNYETFVEEIPRYQPNSNMELVDKFAGESVYIICLRNGGLLGMLSILESRPFSLDGKLDDLDSYLPQANSMCEMRLLTVRKTDRHSRVVYGLFKTAAHYCLDKGHDVAIISGILAQQKQIPSTIVIVEEHIRPSIAALRDMVRQPRHNYPCDPRHEQH